MKYRIVETIGQITTEGGNIPRISTKWRLRDYLGAVAVRLDINRMNYAIQPGLYAVGQPGKDSPVLVSANYKLSFDVLRRELSGLNVWILVIDTKGINVWCAAGKGTFGTTEIIKRVMITSLAKIVTTRQLILPQLGAPGVSAHMIEPFCGFSVKYGPVRACDIKKYLDSGMKTEIAMRRVTFTVGERLEVAWLELALTAAKGVILSLALFLFLGWQNSALLIGVFWAAIFTGTVITAVLLPYIPGRAFSFKGGLLGIVVGLILIHPFKLSLVMFTSAAAAFLALNYTGCSTFTSLSGVKKEIRFALPVIIGMLFLSGILFWRKI
jgi:hypothetical protein